ncbi:RagB/SusD family nutrient uptake outer membrane protein [Flavivirga spongiicola]|uniref:RagB/SusD family nutrient uptake outer membrane protein n=1 Tax=Flavivirga spongiicola TaxID=421621 RepID=A0ABU7XQG1_9FLAO|nr:RagB/SusD family nutrient uptake outer membrane protein [Flavivirga sp. MEBiC05379]MDO5978022.1 RagB/SusD family nutrient uptake outer membrane protein [Flavivirga sp. MEBiC05379]
MKNKFIISTLIAAFTVVLFSCEDDFLEKTPSEFFTQAQISEAAESDPGVIASTLSGIYSLMVQIETGGTTGDDDFGQKGNDIFGDMLCGDMALSVSTFGWYRASITEFQGTQDFTFGDNRQVWRYYYRVVRSANAAIAALGGNDAVPESDSGKHLLGQAKAIRAHSYFYLTQYFANNYNPSAEILPLYDDIDDLNGPKVATSEIYALMESDLRSAITLLDGFNRSAKNEINKPVAQGLLAYVLGSRRDSWAEVATLTKDVIDNGGFPLMTATEIVGGFDDVATPGWMWGIDLTLEIGLDLVSWWGQMDSFSFSYAWAGDFKAIDQALYDQIPENDARKEQFRDAAHPGRPLLPLNKFYHEGRVIGGQRNIETDYIYMRVAEMYLLHAEASARNGAEGDARTALKQLLDLRIPDSSYVDGLSGQALIDEIYLQTRIELWGEGKSYLAMKRNEATITRGSNHLSNVGVPIDHDDERLTFEIPELEIQNNPFIDSQNE